MKSFRFNSDSSGKADGVQAKAENTWESESRSTDNIKKGRISMPIVGWAIRRFEGSYYYPSTSSFREKYFRVRWN